MAARIVSFVFLVSCMAGCVPGGGGSGSNACDPGETDSCACPDGTSGERICGEDERFGACACGPAGDGAIGGDATVGDDAATPDAAIIDAMVDRDGPCVPACDGRSCGGDGCGGVCGACEGDDVCVDGQCEEPPDMCGNGTCDDGESCSSCLEDCPCAEGENCVVGTCEAPVEGAPVFLTLNSNVRRLTEGEAVTFSAVVTDPDGIDDLIGGVLEDPNGQSYGAFVSSGQEGAYSMTISWGEIHRIDPIEFEAARDRVFVAVFFDQGGLRTRQEIAIELHCDGTAACDGTCIDLSDDEANCGACRVECDQNATCGGGACACNDGFFGCGNDSCVPEATVCDRADDCGDGSDEAGCCFADGDCPLGQICGGDSRCADGCTGNDRCPADEQCRDGDCVPGCQRDGDCFENEYCGADNRCAVGCRNDDSCPNGRICEDRACVIGCRDDDGCSAGRICENQTCIVGCREDAVCGNGRICVDDSCRVGCRDDAACGAGQICRNTRCVAGCRDDGACDDGEICEDLSCEPGCRDDGACQLDQICRNARCVAGCQVDDVCVDGQICVDGQCQIGCNDQRPCPDDGVCIDGGCRPGCGVDADCAAGEYCDGICQPHVCGDGRLAPDEECDGDPLPDGCSDRCRIEGDFDRLEEGDEPYVIEFAGPGRVEVLFRIEVEGDTDQFDIRTGAGALRLETRAWTGEGCVGDTVMDFTNANGGVANDDDGGEGLCSLLSIDNGDDAMIVTPGVHSATVRSFSRGPIGFNLFIAEFTPVDVGGACDPFGPEACPAGSYCADGTAICTEHRCGDGIIDPDNEACDDGNDDLGDGCERCQFAVVPQGGPCEPGGPAPCIDGTFCHPVDGLCNPHTCGDGFVSGAEQCEDGNEDAGDGCTACRWDPFNGDAEPDGLDAPYDMANDGLSAQVLFRLYDGEELFSDDQDYFRFTVDGLGHVQIGLVNYPDLDCPGDLLVGVFDEQFNLIGESASSRLNCLAFDSRLAIGAAPLPAGEYFAEITHNFAEATGPIWFMVDILPPAACEDEVDNDGDGLIDAEDPGCAQFADDDEADPAEPAQCSDGEDNDGDMLTDFPDDPDCRFAGGESESCGGYDNITYVGPEGGQFDVSTAGRENLLEASCASRARGGEAPVVVTIEQPSTITVEIIAADYDTSLFSKDGCEADSVELACDDDGGEGLLSRLEVPRAAGTHYFFVDGFSDNSGSATVQVTVVPDAP